MIEIPQNTGDELINWLTSGDKNRDGKSQKQSQEGAIKEGKIVYNRSAATHDVSIKENSQGEFSLEEIKVPPAKEARGFLGNFLGIKTKHYGVDLALNAEFEGNDSAGRRVDRPDGEHGHLYIHYIPPTDKTPGSILIGIEGSSPSSPNHSATGDSNPISAIDGSKFNELGIKQKIAGEPEYADTIIPNKYNGMEVKLNSEALNRIVNINDKDYGIELAYVKPGQSPEDFINKLKNGEYHKAPVFKAPKIVEKATKIKRPNIAKRFMNKAARYFTTAISFATLGAIPVIQPYQKEIEAYKREKIAIKIQNAINDKYEKLSPQSPETISSDGKKMAISEELKHEVEPLHKIIGSIGKPKDVHTSPHKSINEHTM